jgi:hypothetical protein
MAFQAVPAEGNEAAVQLDNPAEDGGRLVAEALGEIPVQAEREYVSENIVLGYN